MGFDNDAVVNMASLPGEFFCAVCRTLVYPNKCMQGPCRHLYCEPCVTHITSTTFTCEYDGEMVTVADCKPLLESNKTLADTIGKVQVLCLYHRSGCTWEGSLSDCTSHCSTCSFGETEVVCCRCGIALKHRQGEEHSQICSGVVSHAQQPSGVPQATSSQTAQVAMLTPEQMCQQQLPYQQYPGCYPYQFYYPYYYEYPQVAEIQAYPQTYGQAPTQYPQVPSLGGQPPLQPQAYAAVNAEYVVPSLWATQPQMQSQGHAQPQTQAQGGQELMGPATSNPSQLLSQASQPFPLQPLQVPLYLGALPKMQHPHMVPYLQSQTQYYPYSQQNPQSQYQSHLNMPASVHPPQQSGAGSQSYSQVQAGAGHTVQPPAYYSSQIQGQYPPNQQQPAMSRGEPLSGPSVQLPAVYPQAQQPRSLFPQQPSVLQQQSSQVPPQGELNHGQPRTAQTNVGHSYAGRPMDVQAVVNPNAKVAGPAGADQARPPQLNHSHPKKTHNQVSRAEQQTIQSQQINNNEAMDIDITSNAASRDNGMPLKTKNDVAISDCYHSRSKRMPDAETKMENHIKEAKPSSKVPVREGNHVKEAKPSTKVGAGGGVLKTSEGVGQKAEVKYTKPTANDTTSSSAPLSKTCEDVVQKTGVIYTKRTANDTTSSSALRSTLHRPHLQAHVHGTTSYPTMNCGRNANKPMPYEQHKPGAASVQQSMAYPTHSHQPTIYGQTTYQLRPQVPVGSIPLHGSSRSQGQPGDLNYHQGPFHHSGQSQNPSDYPFVGPSATAHKPGASRYEIEKFGVQKSGHYDGRRPDSHHHGPTEQNSSEPYRHGIQPGVVNYSGPSANGPMSGPGMPNDFGKFPRRPNFEAGSLPNYGTQFSSSEPLDHGLRMAGGDRMLKPSDMGPSGFDRYPSFKMDGGDVRPDDHVVENHNLVGPPGEFSWIEPPLGDFPPHVSFDASFVGENSGNFPQGELAEHQQKVRDKAFRIKQNKKQKVSKSRVSCEEGRDGGWPKNSGFQGRGNKH